MRNRELRSLAKRNANTHGVTPIMKRVRARAPSFLRLKSLIFRDLHAELHRTWRTYTCCGSTSAGTCAT